MNGRKSYLAIRGAVILAVVLLASLPGCTKMGGLSKSEMDKKLAKAGFFIDPTEPVGSSDPPNTVTRAYSPTPIDGQMIVHTLKYQNGLLTSDVRLSLKPAAPVVAKFFYGFDGKPVVSQVMNAGTPDGLVDKARVEFEKVVAAFMK